MSNSLENFYDPQEFRKKGHELVDLLSDYLEKCQKGEAMDIMPKLNPNESLDFWKNDLKNANVDFSSFIENVVNLSTHVHHPKYIGHQVSAPAPLPVLIDMMGAFLNNGMAVFEMGASSTAMEQIVIQWLAGKFNWKNGGGLITSGGSLANLTALLAARQEKIPNSWNNGHDHQKIALMVSEEAHYCIERAVKILGWGEDGIVKVPTDSNFRIKPSELEKIYADETKKGKNIIAVVGCACTTSTGSYDPLTEIGEFCKKNRLWFHIDAAHGGPVIFSEKYKHLAEGIDLANSIVIDFHKMMLTPALSTAVIFNDKNKAYQTFHQKAAYLLADNNPRWYDTGLKTVECTKRMISTKIYSILKFEGEKIFEDFITQTHDLARYFSKIIRNISNYELAVEPSSNIVCFRFLGDKEDLKTQNKINEEIRQKLVDRGNFYIVKTKLRGIVYLRITIMSPFTRKDHLDELLEEIESIAKEL